MFNHIIFKARQGTARLGKDTLTLTPYSKIYGQAGHGEARRGGARLGKARISRGKTLLI